MNYIDFSVGSIIEFIRALKQIMSFDHLKKIKVLKKLKHQT